MSKSTQLTDALREAAAIRDNQEESIEIREVKKERSKEVKAENSKEVKEDKSKEVFTEEEKVSLTAKVPKSWRRHWLVEAKKLDTSLTADIIEALKARYGLPPEKSE